MEAEFGGDMVKPLDFGAFVEVIGRFANKAVMVALEVADVKSVSELGFPRAIEMEVQSS